MSVKLLPVTLVEEDGVGAEVAGRLRVPHLDAVAGGGAGEDGIHIVEIIQPHIARGTMIALVDEAGLHHTVAGEGVLRTQGTSAAGRAAGIDVVPTTGGEPEVPLVGGVAIGGDRIRAHGGIERAVVPPRLVEVGTRSRERSSGVDTTVVVDNPEVRLETRGDDVALAGVALNKVEVHRGATHGGHHLDVEVGIARVAGLTDLPDVVALLDRVVAAGALLFRAEVVHRPILHVRDTHVGEGTSLGHHLDDHGVAPARVVGVVGRRIVGPVLNTGTDLHHPTVTGRVELLTEGGTGGGQEVVAVGLVAVVGVAPVLALDHVPVRIDLHRHEDQRLAEGEAAGEDDDESEDELNEPQRDPL